jgi:glutathione S-transferase
MANDELEPGEHVFHLALSSDWEAARCEGSYRISSRGRTLAEEGFIHTSRRHQVQGVHDAYYSDVTEPLVLLEIDPARLSTELVLEVPHGADQAFPHVYGPIDLDAVVKVDPMPPSSPGTA